MKISEMILFGSLLIQCTPSKSTTGTDAVIVNPPPKISANSEFQLTGDECTQLSGDTTCTGIFYAPGNATVLHTVTPDRCTQLGGTWTDLAAPAQASATSTASATGDCSFNLDTYKSYTVKCLDPANKTDTTLTCAITVTPTIVGSASTNYEIKNNHVLSMDQPFEYHLMACPLLTGKVDTITTMGSPALLITPSAKCPSTSITDTTPDTEGMTDVSVYTLTDQYAIDTNSTDKNRKCTLVLKRGPKGCGPEDKGYDSCYCQEIENGVFASSIPRCPATSEDTISSSLYNLPDAYAIASTALDTTRKCCLVHKNGDLGCGPEDKGYDNCHCVPASKVH